ncbi:MAG: TetR/AcrR family transcriptional regulator [Longimicrobiales bacterium]|nr:TetR/AcrR family transcriptional regulator [Longimicrobiales bacterium]
MARARFDNLEPERQETILAAAADEFAAHGYSGASLNRIIEAAGISKGSLYYYFDDKADLFASVVEAAMERLSRVMEGLSLEDLDRTNFWARVREVGLRSIDLMKEDTWDVRLAMAFPRLRDEPEAGEGVRPMLEWSRDFTTSLLRRGRELRVVRRDLPLELLVEITLAADEAGDRWLVEHLDEYGDPERLRKLMEARIDLLRDMLDAENEGWP